MQDAVVETNLPLGPPYRGKVRDCYRLADTMLIVSTDRISAFDWILPTPIPGKGKVLTTISEFWFDLLSSGPEPIAHHLIRWCIMPVQPGEAVPPLSAWLREQFREG